MSPARIKSATKAAIRAGYSEKTARAIGQENLTKPDIQAAISAAQEARSIRQRLLTNVDIQEAISKAMKNRSIRTEITQDMVLEELAKIAAIDTTAIVEESAQQSAQQSAQKTVMPKGRY